MSLRGFEPRNEEARKRMVVWVVQKMGLWRDWMKMPTKIPPKPPKFLIRRHKIP